MKEIIIAQQLEGDYFDYEMYYDEEQASYDKFCGVGNRNFQGFNSDLHDDVAKALENCGWDLENGINSDMSDADKEDEKLSICRYYFKSLTGEGITLTDADYKDLGKLALQWNGTASSDEIDLVCEALTILHGEIFVHDIIRGSSQGDWMECIFPDGFRSLSYVEAVLFGTGTEYRVSIVEVEDDFDLTDKDALLELAEQDDDYTHDYTDEWRDDDIKQWIADNASYVGHHFTKDDVILIEL